MGKCKVMHLGRTNQGHIYTKDGWGTNREVVTEERDLGVLFDKRLDFDKHVRAILGKVSRMLGLIKFSFECMYEYKDIQESVSCVS